MKEFVDSFNEVAKECHQNSVNHGFWEGEQNSGEKIALMHSELSEALEAIREGNPSDKKLPEFTGVETELADAIIRIMDFSVRNNFRVAEALIAKHNYNLSRPYKHGKSF